MITISVNPNIHNAQTKDNMPTLFLFLSPKPLFITLYYLYEWERAAHFPFDLAWHAIFALELD